MLKKFLFTLLVLSLSVFAKDSGFNYNKIFIEAKSGNIDSQMLLGEMYLDGINIEVDHQKAFFWLSKAARNGDEEAEYLLGFMYENGLYVSQDIKRATKWYTKSAQQGDVLAQFNLAVIYKEGKGEVKKDMKMAFKWLNEVQKSRENIKHIASK